MKTTIKKLAGAIDKVLADNAEATYYYNGLFDDGEWSQTGPDFTSLIKSWNLNRRRLCLWSWTAWEYAKEFEQHFPGRTHGYTKRGPYCLNPWQNIAETLDIVFMAGFLNPPHQDNE